MSFFGDFTTVRILIRPSQIFLGEPFSFKVCPWIRMFQMIPRLHNFLKFFDRFYISLFFNMLQAYTDVL